MIRRILLSLLLATPIIANAQLQPGIPVEGKDFVGSTAFLAPVNMVYATQIKNKPTMS